MKISVVIPVRNRPHSLPRAVESALGQTNSPDEIIIVDDGSTDSTPEVGQQLARDERKVMFLRLENNGGAPIARNTGAAAASGELLAFLDSDDVWKPTKLEKQSFLLSRFPDSPAVYCGFEYHYLKRAVRVAIPKPCVTRTDLYGRNVLGGTSCVLVRRSAFKDAGRFLEGLPSCQDWELWLRLAKLGPLRSVQEPLVEYHFDGEGRISKNRANVEKGHETVFGAVNAAITDPRELKIVQAKQAIRMAEVYAKQFLDSRAVLRQVRHALRLNPTAETMYTGVKAISNLLIRN